MSATAHISETIYRLDGPLRWAVGEANELIRKTRLHPGVTVLDVGAGTGYLSIPLARVVGESGSVHSFDASPELLSVLGEKAARQGYARRITLRQGPAERLSYPDGFFDFVFSSYTLHELEDPMPALREMHRVLKPLGEVAISDYRRIEDEGRRSEIEGWYARQADQHGDRESHLRFSLQAMESMLACAGFRDIQLSTWLDFHMHAVATKID